jgi:hypothetical protein
VRANYVLWAAKADSKLERRPLTLGPDRQSKRQYSLPGQLNLKDMILKSYVKSLKANWILLVQAATFVSLTVKGFVSPSDHFDPVAAASETKRLAAFIVALLVGVFFLFRPKVVVDEQC